MTLFEKIDILVKDKIGVEKIFFSKELERVYRVDFAMLSRLTTSTTSTYFSDKPLYHTTTNVELISIHGLHKCNYLVGIYDTDKVIKVMLEDCNENM